MKRLLLLVIVCIIGLTAAWANGQQAAAPADGRVWPVHKSIEVVSTSAASSGTDAVGRAFVDYLNRSFPGTNFYTVNESGGAGTVGYEKMRNARPDGSTFAFDAVNLIVSYAFGSYNHSLDDFTIIHNLQVPNPEPMIGVRPDSKYKDFMEFYNDAKAHPNTVSSPFGHGTSTYARGVGLEMDLGVTFRKVDGTGNAERMSSLIGGMVDFVMISPASIEPYVKSGDVRLLAITGNERTDIFPDVPSIKEFGFPFETMGTGGHYTIFGPKGMDEKVVNAISETIKGFAEDPQGRELMFRLEKSYPVYIPRADGVKKLYDLQDFLVKVAANQGN